MKITQKIIDDLTEALAHKKKDGTDAFSFGVTRNSANKFGIGVEMSEAYGLREFLKFYLQELYIYRLSKNKEFRNS